MKKFIFILTTVFLLTSLISCDSDEIKLQKAQTATGYPIYSISSDYVVPLTMKAEQQQWILDAISSGKLHHTGGDDADMDDVIRQAERTSKRLFQQKVYYLVIDPSSGDYDAVTFEPHELNGVNREIFDLLRSGQRTKIKTLVATQKPKL